MTTYTDTYSKPADVAAIPREHAHRTCEASQEELLLKLHKTLMGFAAVGTKIDVSAEVAIGTETFVFKLRPGRLEMSYL